MRKILLSLSVILISVQLAKAQQDAQFSQYMFNGIYINPAYAGYREQLNIQGFYRNQWTGITGAPQTGSLAVDATANNYKVGLAFQMSNDRLGAQDNLSAYANYAYRLQMNQDGTSRLALGLGFGVVQLGIDGSKLHPNDPELYQPVGTQSKIMPDARLGVYYSDTRWYAGVSADNLITQFYNVSSFSFIPQPKPHYYLTAGVLAPLSEDLLLKPSFLIKDDTAGPASLDLTMFLIIQEHLWIGASYRTGIFYNNKNYLQQDLIQPASVAFAIQLFQVKNFNIGYTYDLSVGPLRTYSSGTHEISLGYYFDKKNVRMLTPRYF
jgi:type IX secretion system PorP/SprF family membrane protein